jgi:hypothetical protein
MTNNFEPWLRELLSNDNMNGTSPQRETLSGRIDLVVILAPPRCYTTLVCAMLGQHPQMYGLPETYLFTRRTMQEWWSTYQGNDRGHGLSRAVAELVFKGQTDVTIVAARRWISERLDRSTADLLRALSAEIAPLIPVEKTPQTAERLVHMQRIIRNFPRTKFLHLLRHPFGHVQSRVNRRLKNLRKFKPTVGLAEAAQHFGGADPQTLWHLCNSNILAFLDTLPLDQYMRIRGEDLLTDPDRYLRDITHWLNLRSDPEAIEAMKHPERSPFACVGPLSAPKGGDENFFDRPSLRPITPTVQTLDSAVPWRTDGVGFSSNVRELARLLGYK